MAMPRQVGQAGAVRAVGLLPADVHGSLCLHRCGGMDDWAWRADGKWIWAKRCVLR